MASPEDTPMKKQWLEVDGRMTPVILPQIWNHDKEEWEVTSEQNPLPTQVTGSIVELYKNDSVEIESNSRIILKDITKMSKKQVTASIRAESSHDFLLDVDWRTSATGSSGYSIETEKMIEADNELSARSEENITTKTNVARFRLAINSAKHKDIFRSLLWGWTNV